MSRCINIPETVHLANSRKKICEFSFSFVFAIWKWQFRKFLISYCSFQAFTTNFKTFDQVLFEVVWRKIWKSIFRKKRSKFGVPLIQTRKSLVIVNKINEIICGWIINNYNLIETSTNNMVTWDSINYKQ